MNKEQHELLLAAYNNYLNEWLKENPPFSGPYTDKCLSQEDFINKCKTDPEFSKKWKLTIEEQELSDDERYNLLPDTEKRSFIVAIIPGVEYGEEVKYTLDTFYKHVPTKIITITYNDKTIDSYEPIR